MDKNHWNPIMRRRSFLQHTAAAGAGLFYSLHSLPFRALFPHLVKADSPAIQNISPLMSISDTYESGIFNGDDVTRPHDIFWNLENYIRSKGGRPSSQETANVVIVGGGVAGMTTAHLLRDLQPIVLEQAETLGGNAKGEVYQGTSFSIGAAYLTPIDQGSALDKLLKEVGMEKAYRHEASEEARVYLRSKGLLNLWAGESDPAAQASAQKVQEELVRIYEHAFPSIPWTPESPLSWQEFQSLDQQTAEQWLLHKFPDIHPHIKEYFQLYCWSSFGGSLEELSAAQFLNFVSAEVGGVIAFPGGNSAILHAIYQTNKQSISFRAKSIVLEMKNTPNGVEILYEGSDGNLRSILARAAVVAAPKYAARYIVKDLPAERNLAWKQLPYRAYVVANILLKHKSKDIAYDVFSLEGSVPEAPRFGTQTNRPWADFLYADWANHGNGSRSILTLYKPLPFDGARNSITSALAHERIYKELQEELPKIFSEIGMGENQIEGIRLTRWGHALPLSRPGILSDKNQLENLAAPHGKIAFANQDNYMNPAFETAFDAAQEAVKFICSLF